MISTNGEEKIQMGCSLIVMVVSFGVLWKGFFVLFYISFPALALLPVGLSDVPTQPIIERNKGNEIKH